MTSLELLPIILAFQLAAIGVIVSGLFWISARRLRLEKKHQAGVVAARQAIAIMLESGSHDDEAQAVFSRLPRSLQIRLIWELAPKLVGDSILLLAELGRKTGLVAWAVESCGSSRWHIRLQGIRMLTLLQIFHEAAKHLLDDPHPLVRAQALEWAADHVTGGNIRSMIEHFDDPSHLCLFTTQDALLRVGNPAIPYLAEYLSDESLEAPSAALDVACGLADPRFLETGLKLSRHHDEGVRAKAVGLLAGIGGDAAIQRLLELLDDPSGRVRTAVASGFGELGHWPAAAAVAGLLRDPNYEVRREAGLALQNLGSPGALMLRKFRGDGDRFAADMAIQILDLPRLQTPEQR